MNSTLLPPPESPARVVKCPGRRERSETPERPRAGSVGRRGVTKPYADFPVKVAEAKRSVRRDHLFDERREAGNGDRSEELGAPAERSEAARKIGSEEPPRRPERTAREAKAERRSVCPGSNGAAGASRARAGVPFMRGRASGGMGGHAPHIERNLRSVESLRDSHQCKSLVRAFLGIIALWQVVDFENSWRENR